MTMPTFQSFAEEHYLPLYITNPRYQRSIQSFFQKVVYPAIGALPLDQIRPIDTNMILYELYSTHRSNITIANYYNSMKRVFLLAIQKDILHRDPCMAHFRHDDHALYTFPEDLDTHAKMLNVIERLPLRNFYGFSYTTGFSIRELRPLRRSDLDLENRLLHLNTAKHPGRIWIPDEAMPYLEDELRKQTQLPHIEDNFLFVTDTGSHIPHTHTRICTHIVSNLMQMPKFRTNDLWMGYGNTLRFMRGDL